MVQRKPQVLVVDDGAHYARVVEEQLTDVRLIHPDNELCLHDGPAALAWLGRHHRDVDVILLDMQFDVPEERLLPLPGEQNPKRVKRYQGLAILQELRRRHPELPVVLLTAVADLSLVDVHGQLQGQSMTYVLDGDDLDTLRIRINAALREAAQGLEEDDLVWGGNPTMLAVRRRLRVLSRGGMPVVLEGETGTGKSFLAERFIHRNSGRSGAFVTLDLSTVPADLVAAHLFGALRGSYTSSVADRKGAFELAHKGTLFLDEVQNVPLDVQKQLLVVLQERKVRPLGAARELEVDVKVVAASNQPLAVAVAEGRFRQDLFMRLGPAMRVTLPPLRERAADVLLLARRFAAQAADHRDNADLKALVAQAAGVKKDAAMALMVGRETRGGEDGALLLAVPDPAWRQLMEHPWPGNVRELHSVMHNLVSFTLVAAVDAIQGGLSVKSPRLQVDAGLVHEVLSASATLARREDGGADGGADRFMLQVRPAKSLNAVAVDVERQYFTALFRRHNGDFSRMADSLLGDAAKERAIRLRFNQMGLKVREMKGT